MIERQFPVLRPVRLETLGVGWDNIAFQVNQRLVFRFPRRKLGGELMAREVRVLPRLAPHLPLPIPVPEYLGQPEGEYPYPFAGYRLVPGTPACRLAWTDDQRAAAAVPLARFLAALHTISVDDATRAWAPDDNLERTNLLKRLLVVEERLPVVTNADPDLDPEAVLDLYAELAAAPPWRGPTCWVHGDLYPCHFLADAERAPCGVIDWGDVHLGDPALDLMLAWTFLPPAARAVFGAAYGPIDPATSRRARCRALFYGVALTHYGVEISDPEMRDTGIYALRAALEERARG